MEKKHQFKVSKIFFILILLLISVNSIKGNTDDHSVSLHITSFLLSPKFSDADSPTTIYQNDTATFNITIIDDLAIHGYWFSWNHSGTWVNDTYVDVTQDTYAAINVSKNVNLTKDSSISWKFYANDTDGNLNVSNMYNITVLQFINVTAQSFSMSHGSTNFSNVSDLTNVTNMILATQYGKIQFPRGHSINAEGEDYDSFVNIGSNFISVNLTGLDTSFNHSVNITMNNLICPVYVVYASGFHTNASEIIANGYICDATTYPSCRNINCTGNIVTFTVDHFSGFAVFSRSILGPYDAQGGSRRPQGLNDYGSCIYYNGTWVGGTITGYCIYLNEDIKSFRKLGWDLINFINRIDVNNVGMIGAQISPSNPTLGWTIFTLFIIFIYSMIKTLPYFIRSKLEQTKRKDQPLPLYVKYSITGMFVIAVAILWWAKDSFNPLMWKEIGQQISPSNPTVGWAIFALFIIFLYSMHKTLPYLVRSKLEKTRKKDGSLSPYVTYSIVGILTIIAVILWWAKDSINPTRWTEIGAQISQNILFGWLIFFLGAYYVVWVFTRLLPALIKRQATERRSEPQRVPPFIFNFQSPKPKKRRYKNAKSKSKRPQEKKPV